VTNLQCLLLGLSVNLGFIVEIGVSNAVLTLPLLACYFLSHDDMMVMKVSAAKRSTFKS
jgi:hypothetical protein